jgi:polysaccharide deacetylase family protein (PEP-CTERM system associated)
MAPRVDVAAVSLADGPRRDATGRMVNALSIDVEDYYHVSAFAGTIPREDWPRWPGRVEGNMRRILDLLGEADIRATFFVLGCVAREHPGIVRAIASAGHELSSHGFGHKRVWEQSPKEFAKDVGDAKRLLEDLAGVPVKGYRAPSFSIDERTWWAFDILAETGHSYSSSVNPIRHDHYGMPHAPRGPFSPRPDMIEMPISTIEIHGRRIPCGGGGYFRLLPYSLSCWTLRRLNESEGRAGIFYFHPWEIDPDQPRIAGAPLRARFRHYVNLGTREVKIRSLLRDFAWSGIDAMCGNSAAATLRNGLDALDYGVATQGRP